MDRIIGDPIACERLFGKCTRIKAERAIENQRLAAKHRGLRASDVLQRPALQEEEELGGPKGDQVFMTDVVEQADRDPRGGNPGLKSILMNGQSSAPSQQKMPLALPANNAIVKLLKENFRKQLLAKLLPAEDDKARAPIAPTTILKNNQEIAEIYREYVQEKRHRNRLALQQNQRRAKQNVENSQVEKR